MPTHISHITLQPIHLTLWIFTPGAIVMGVLMQCYPIAFWQVLGLSAGTDATLSRLYGAVLLGVGLLSLHALKNPVKHMSLFLFIGYYKGIASLMLTYTYFTQPTPNIATLTIALLYGSLALLCLALYSRSAPQQSLAATPEL